MAGFTAAPHRCPTCGVTNAAYATFCIECGESLDGAAPRQWALGRTAAPRARSEAARPQTIALRRELWLGVLLIVGVLGFALFDWHHQEEQAAGYRAGDTAATARHWTAAHAAFARLGDYRDALRRTTDTATLMHRRDTSYQAGETALRDNDFITAYRTLSETVAIEPDYQDAAALLDQAGRQIIQTALADTIYRRVSGGTPGLYARRANAADWRLPGSDATSQVWSANAYGRVVYDGPMDPAPLPVPDWISPPADDGERHLPAGRQLWLVEVGSAAPPKPLSRIFGLGGGLVVAQTGVWWYEQARPDAEAYHGYNVQGEPLRLLVYYDLQALRATQATLAENTYFLLDSAAETGQLLIGHYSWTERASPSTQLYLAGPSGATLQPLAEVAGVVNTARFSPDGRYLLYSDESVVPGSENDNRLELVAVNLVNPQHPAEVLARMTAASLSELALRGTFVPGPGSPRVVIRRLAGTMTLLSVRNLHTDVEETLMDGAHLWWDSMKLLPTFWLPADGQNLLFWDQQNGNTPTLVIEPLTPQQPAIRLAPFAPMLSTRPTFVQVALSGDSVFYTVTRIPPAAGSGIVGQVATAIYGASAANPTAAAVPLCLQPFHPDGNGRIMALGDVVACANADNNVRLRSLDGETNLTTLDGVDALWPLHQTMWLWQP